MSKLIDKNFMSIIWRVFNDHTNNVIQETVYMVFSALYMTHLTHSFLVQSSFYLQDNKIVDQMSWDTPKATKSHVHPFKPQISLHVTGRPCGSVAQWSECSHGLREVLGRLICVFVGRIGHKTGFLMMCLIQCVLFRAAPPKLIKSSVPLPISTREMRHPDFSTSDEDDDEVLGSPVGDLDLYTSEDCKVLTIYDNI